MVRHRSRGTLDANLAQAVEGRRPGLFGFSHETLGPAHIATAYLLVVTVFSFDLVVPLGAGLCFFYLLPVVFLVLWSSPKQARAVLGIAALSLMLMGVGFWLAPPGHFWYAVSNRAYVAIVVGVTILLSVARKQAEELRRCLPICSYCKRIRDDEGYWQQVERYIAARSAAADFSHSVCPDCGDKHFPDRASTPWAAT